ncbi:hypothetical protein MMC16_001129 [Acarospora aff. strigata]|nr:hypothetical protein [Acarospora aff. strigata]
MQSVQRRFGKFLPRSADESQVSVLLKDFEDADRMLTKIIDASKAWRDSWTSILGAQHRLIDEFNGMFSPIIGAGESYSGHEPAPTPEKTMEKTTRLRDNYEALKTDLLEEVNLVDSRMVKPAMEAKDYIQPMKKTIKNREDKKLDYERYQGRVDSARKKTKRSDRENASLAKAETDLAKATEEYHAADAHLKSTLPPVIIAVYSILPHLLASQIMTQNALLAHYYTMLHTYCQDEQFPSPPPPMEEVISVWQAEFKTVQHEVETGIDCIAKGKAVRQPMKLEDQVHGSTMTGLNIRNGITQRRASGHIPPQRPPSRSPSIGPPSPTLSAKPRIASLPSPSLSAVQSPPASSSSAVTSPSPSEYQTPQAYSPAAPRTDYFNHSRQPSSSSFTSAAAAKKKPPPPPPTKRHSSSQGVWVTALYDFAGQGSRDLVFKEGDRIRVTKKTGSTDDWWEGELKGVQGSFPANYCQVV